MENLGFTQVWLESLQLVFIHKLDNIPTEPVSVPVLWERTVLLVPAKPLLEGQEEAGYGPIRGGNLLSQSPVNTVTHKRCPQQGGDIWNSFTSIAGLLVLYIPVCFTLSIESVRRLY